MVNVNGEYRMMRLLHFFVVLTGFLKMNEAFKLQSFILSSMDGE